MGPPPLVTLVACSAEASKNFVDWYYASINDGKSVAQGYVNASERYTAAGQPPADICINGRVVATPEEWDALLAQQRRAANPTASANPFASTDKVDTVRYEVASYDVHVINSDYRFAAPPEALVDYTITSNGGTRRKAEGSVRIVMMLAVSGTVHFTATDGRPLAEQHFHDVFILVPNWDTILRHGSRATRRYIAISHTYRAY
ncbi:hypothetical protein B0T26DRAFT_672723 [Lasiosphaeria miniovina]|uniref:NTF2 domain-containing protein n=1 Tax=Lasiosphaeria miniovina TaxID=1954250 RepID=A0AA40B5M2_9PEZI|nr:uncharacterized protein B0T26DRAFT_672723 [Lasiosphaeria miniovina]KAK0728141.1 hypothetical protein B0T26DRAFT_672723 [Lasiosphaeria miniovina]